MISLISPPMYCAPAGAIPPARYRYFRLLHGWPVRQSSPDSATVCTPDLPVGSSTGYRHRSLDSKCAAYRLDGERGDRARRWPRRYWQISLLTALLIRFHGIAADGHRLSPYAAAGLGCHHTAAQPSAGYKISRLLQIARCKSTSVPDYQAEPCASHPYRHR